MRLSSPSPVTAFYGDSAGVFSRDEFDCNIGGDILRRFRVYFDYSRNEMILEPNASINDPFEADMGGLAFRIENDGLRVTDLMPKGPAEVAGLLEGDLIVAVDGRPAAQTGVEGLRQRLRRPGGEVTFTVRRNGKDIEIRMPVRRIV